MSDKGSSAPPPPDADARARAFATQALPAGARREALRLVTSLIDLTTLESTDTAARVRRLCARARRPHDDPAVPPVAAVCVFPTFVRGAKHELADTPVRVAAAAGGFPTAQTFLDVRLDEVRHAVQEGADEVDVVMPLAPLFEGDDARVHHELAATREACGDATLKVILETGVLPSQDAVRRAAQIAIDTGADFLKTSTGKVAVGATPAAALVMCETIRDHARGGGRRVGMKVAGGLRSVEQTWPYVAMVRETLGEAWLAPELLRIGASSLLDDVLALWDRERAP